MPYGKDSNVSGSGMNELKKVVSEKLGGVDPDNVSPDQVKNMLVNEINRNDNIDPAIKDKINKGDIDGLKEDIINYLSKNRSSDGSSDQLINMLKNNDMDGLKRQLMGMLLSGLGSQKKNEIEEPGADKGQTSIEDSLGSFDEKALMGLLFDKMFAGVKDDRRILLLNSVKPFVSEKRQKGIDDCVRIMNLVAFFENFMSKAGK
ncbi:MAG: nucleotidyltransferase family protein [Gracilibacteraceae bacterium]|nr:nucleotidyltransferase family protein [Gracilibacteraceae bacterium]